MSVCTLKQNIGGTSRGFTNIIKSNQNVFRSDWKCSPVHTYRFNQSKWTFSTPISEAGRCVFPKVGEWQRGKGGETPTGAYGPQFCITFVFLCNTSRSLVLRNLITTPNQVIIYVMLGRSPGTRRTFVTFFYTLTKRWYLQHLFSCDQAALRTLLSVWPSIRPFVCVSVHPSIHPSICLSVCLYVCTSVCMFVCHTFFTMFFSSYHHEMFRSYYHWQKDPQAKGYGQKSTVKVTEVRTNFAPICVSTDCNYSINL